MRSLSRILRRLLRLDAVSRDLVIEEQLRKNRTALEEKRRQWAEQPARTGTSWPEG